MVGERAAGVPRFGAEFEFYRWRYVQPWMIAAVITAIFGMCALPWVPHLGWPALASGLLLGFGLAGLPVSWYHSRGVWLRLSLVDIEIVSKGQRRFIPWREVRDIRLDGSGAAQVLIVRGAANGADDGSDVVVRDLHGWRPDELRDAIAAYRRGMVPPESVGPAEPAWERYDTPESPALPLRFERDRIGNLALGLGWAASAAGVALLLRTWGVGLPVLVAACLLPLGALALPRNPRRCTWLRVDEDGLRYWGGRGGAIAWRDIVTMKIVDVDTPYVRIEARTPDGGRTFRRSLRPRETMTCEKLLALLTACRARYAGTPPAPPEATLR